MTTTESTLAEVSPPTAKVARAVGARKVTRAGTAKPAETAVDKSRVSTETLLKLQELGRASDTIELKLSVPATDHRATIQSLRLDPVEAQPRQAFFFDTANLDLSKAGLVIRARRIQGGTADTVIKLRPVDPSQIDPKLRRSANFKVELDVVPGGFVCSASFKGTCTGKDVVDVAAGKAPLRSLFSKEQRAFYKTHAPAGLKMKSLRILGPTFLLKAKHKPKEFKRGVTVEVWLYPDGSRILEISTKALPGEALKVAAEFKDFLARSGINISEIQETKTKNVLDFFSKKLA